MYLLLGTCLALASFFALNAFASALISLLGRIATLLAQRWSARTRAEFLFALRIAGPIFSLIVVAILFVPSYVGYEPYGTSEVVSRKLATLAAISFLGLGFAFWRAFRSWIATRRLERQWLRDAVSIRLPLLDIPTFRIAHPFPIIAVVGTLRPRLFIAEHVLESLTEDELAAAIAHETGHLAARDNFKRALLRICRDLLTIVPSGRSLDRAWAESVECAADEHAAQLSPDVALNLASALVRIARMVPVGMRTELPLATFLVGEETRGIKTRVRRLIEIASASRSNGAQRLRIGALAPVAGLLAFVTLTIAVAANSHVLLRVHSVVEQVVSLLS
ncbi:MAG TPA: M48 family metalloprotease [Pyrinomonadaceae bacterium]|nr:M48 family metalloprotease [Pyrinomonadaceae bacterium]